MQKFIFPLIGLIVLILIAIGIRVMLPGANIREDTAVETVQALAEGNRMKNADRADFAYTDTNITNEKKLSAGTESEQETTDITSSGIPASSSAGSRFSGSEAKRPSDDDIKRYIEMKKETLAMQKGPEALEHYYDLKQEREQKTLAREEYRTQRREYDAQRREWKLKLDKAEEQARMTGDYAQVDELKQLEPVRPKRHPDKPVESEQE
ncbi:MAG TPA: hypothetical protein PLU81_08975 [Deltaproteobacteria bacterium]|nr:hypothetical protein [Deltaproteobacteria bacterium]